MKITSRSTLTEVSFAVCTALQRSGTIAVLTGGSAATYYAPQRYQSRDVDFVVMTTQDLRAAARALLEIGFSERDGVYYHPETSYTLEFPKGPLSIGRRLIQQYETIRQGGCVLHVLSRSDSVCDRLAGFYHWDDRSSLRTAVDVALSGEIDLGQIERWSKEERQIDKFSEFSRGYHEELRHRQTDHRRDDNDRGR